MASFSFGTKENTGPEYLINEDSLTVREGIKTIKGHLSFYQPLWQNQVFAVNFNGSYIEGDKNQLQLSDHFWFGGFGSLRGYRENQFNGKFRTDQLVSADGVVRWVNGETDKSAWRNHAYDLGLTWFYSDRVSFFSNVGTSFRIPNVDEFAESEPGLKPQKGAAWEVGTRYKVPDRLEVTLTVFHMDECLDWEGKLLARNHPYNFHTFMEQHFYDPIEPELAVSEGNRNWPTAWSVTCWIDV